VQRDQPISAQPEDLTGDTVQAPGDRRFSRIGGMRGDRRHRVGQLEFGHHRIAGHGDDTAGRHDNPGIRPENAVEVSQRRLPTTQHSGVDENLHVVVEGVEPGIEIACVERVVVPVGERQRGRIAG
jgi:hypothetical protein